MRVTYRYRLMNQETEKSKSSNSLLFPQNRTEAINSDYRHVYDAFSNDN